MDETKYGIKVLTREGYWLWRREAGQPVEFEHESVATIEASLALGLWPDVDVKPDEGEYRLQEVVEARVVKITLVK